MSEDRSDYRAWQRANEAPAVYSAGLPSDITAIDVLMDAFNPPARWEAESAVRSLRSSGWHPIEDCPTALLLGAANTRADLAEQDAEIQRTAALEYYELWHEARDRGIDLHAALSEVLEVLRCLHDFDPECARCEWLAPFKRLVVSERWTNFTQNNGSDDNDVWDASRTRGG
jgi:hypothetical protein